MLNKFTNIIINHPKRILFAVTVITLFALVGLTKLQVESDFTTSLPTNDPLMLSDKKVQEHFNQTNNIWIGIKSDNIFQDQTLRQVASITEDVKELEWVIRDEVKSLTTVNNIKGVEDGIEVGAYLKTIPQSEKEFQELAVAIRQDNLLSGHLVSRDEKFTIIAANLEEGYDSRGVFDALQNIKSSQPNPNNIYLAGTLVQLEELDRAINNDLNVLVPIALILIIIGYYFTFRTWRGVWLPFSMVLLSIIWTVGIQGWIGIPITVVTSILPLLMIAVSSSYGIHLLHRYYEDIPDYTSIEGTRKTVEHISPILLMTGVTSALGTLTLLVFKVGLIREFGVLATIGMLVIMVLSLTFMPALLVLLKKQKNPLINRNHSKSDWMTKLVYLAIHQRNTITIISVLLLVGSIWGITKIRVGDDLASYFQKGHVVNQVYNAFNLHMNGADNFDVMFDTREVDGVKNPMVLKEIESFQQYAESLPNVGTTSSFVDIIKRINQELHTSDPNYLKIPSSQAEVSQYMLLYSLSGAPEDFSSLVDYDYQRTKIQVMIKSAKQEDHLALYKQLQQYKPQYLQSGFGLEFGGEAIKWLAYIKYVVEGKILNMIAAILIVLLFCSWVFKALKIGLVAILPLLFSMITTLGLMGFLGIPLEMTTAIITAIGVGIGIDFAIHFIMRLREEVIYSNDLKLAIMTTMNTAGRAISFDVLSNILGFSVLLFSGIQPLQNFGGLVSITMLSLSLSTLLIVPAIILIFKFNFSKKDNTINPPSSSILPIEL